MRPQSIEDDELIDALSRVISRHGYEGASLQMLSDAAGLKRASLYHRFPGGKAEILESALQRAADRFDVMLAPAFENGEPNTRARDVAERIDDYYGGGTRSCLIVAMSLDDDERRSMATPCIDAWTAAFARIAKDAGVPKSKAADRAQDLVAQIEGTLIISSATGNTKPFHRALKQVPGALTAP